AVWAGASGTIWHWPQQDGCPLPRLPFQHTFQTPRMIRFLSIQRLAVIDQLELEFGPGFTVLTGETGAGKSILMEAVGLLLGGRAAADLVRTGADSALIQAALETSNGEELLVRREGSAHGRSRAFIDPPSS